MRELAYYEAKFEALHEIMAADERVHLINGTFLSLSPHRHLFQDLVKKYGDFLECAFGNPSVEAFGKARRMECSRLKFRAKFFHAR